MHHADTHPPQQPCPTRADWEDFLHGRLLLDRQVRLSDHLEACPACAAILPALDFIDDDLVRRIKAEPAVLLRARREPPRPGDDGLDFTKDPGCAAAMRRLRLLLPLLEGTPTRPSEPS